MKLVAVFFVPLLLLVSSAEGRVKMIATPVVYTNNNGGGHDELQVPPNSGASKLFDAGGPVFAAWWVPYDNIGDLSAIHNIQATASGNNVNLMVHGHPSQRSARVRIMLYAEMADNYTT